MRGSTITRITAFWALCESGLGGVLHAIQLPFKGVLLCYLSVLCITLIGKTSNRARRDILRATVVVILIKGIISPHSPVTAYFAVGFQGLVGAFLWGKGSHPWMIWPLSVVVFIESAAQKLLTLWLFFGNSFWDAADGFGHWVVGVLGSSSGGWVVPVSIYFSIYFIAGLVTAWLIPIVHTRMEHYKDLELSYDRVEAFKIKRKSRKKRWLLPLILTTVILTYVLYHSGINSMLIVFLRSVLVIYLWFKYVGPWLSRLLIKKLETKSSAQTKEHIRDIMESFPEMKKVVIASWQYTQQWKMPKRWIEFVSLSLAQILWSET